MLMSYQHHQSAYPTAFTAASDMQRTRESRMTAPPRAARPAASSEDAAHEFVYSDATTNNNTSNQDSELQFQHAYHHYDQQHVRDPHHHHASSSGGARLYPSISGSYASGSFEYVQQQPVAPVAQGSMLYGSSHTHTNWASMSSYTSHHVDTTAPSAATTASTLGGLPELRADFHESDAMFSGTDEYNDAKILHEVLQDNQQLSHHERHSLSLGGGSSNNNSGFASLPHQYQSQYNSSVMASYPHSSASPINMSDLLLPPLTTSFSGSTTGYTQPTSSSPSSSSYVSSSAGSPVSSLSSSGHHGANMKKKPASRICRMPGCSKGIRSRGLCKGHGGGRRCLTPGCEISDQGGGHCIAHGGGKRCTVPGCQKSAQSKGLCKLHGGARRCKVPNCAKNCQVKGLCRLHYSMYAASSNPMATASTSLTSSPANSPSKFAFASHTLDLQTTYIRSQ